MSKGDFLEEASQGTRSIDREATLILKGPIVFVVASVTSATQ